MTHIDFEAKTNRELLLLVAQQGNETVDHLERLNDTIVKHEDRITALEIGGGCSKTKPKWKPNWQYCGLIASCLALVVMAVGARVGWW